MTAVMSFGKILYSNSNKYVVKVTEQNMCCSVLFIYL